MIVPIAFIGPTVGVLATVLGVVGAVTLHAYAFPIEVASLTAAWLPALYIVRRARK